MSTFKIKHEKTKHAVHINTLDETHKKIMTTFQNRKTLLPKKKKRIELLKSQLSALDNIDGSKYTTDDIKKRSELKTEIKDLNDEIFDIENNLSELDYYCKTEDIIMDYYQITDVDDHVLYGDNPELCEEKKNLDKEYSNKDVDKLDMLNIMNKNKRRPKKITKRRKKKVINSQQSSILDFLSGNVSMSIDTTIIETEDEFTETDITETETEIETEKIKDDDCQDSIIEKQENYIKNKAELLDQYMMLIDSEYICDKKKTLNQIRRCEKCNIEKTLINSEGMFVCQQCGEFEQVIIDSEKPNYKEAVTDAKPGYPYKRINFWQIARICVHF